MGRPRVLSDDTVARIRELRADGLSLQKIADRMMDEGVLTAHGGAKWHPSTIRRVLNPALAPGSGHVAEATVERVAALAADGLGEQVIADLLNAEGVHTEKAQWTAPLVRHVAEWVPSGQHV